MAVQVSAVTASEAVLCWSKRSGQPRERLAMRGGGGALTLHAPVCVAMVASAVVRLCVFNVFAVHADMSVCLFAPAL